MTDMWWQYAEDVVSGKIPACLSLRQGCQRSLDWRHRTDMYFDEKKVRKIVNFVQCFKHGTGEFAGKKFVLLPF